MGNTLSIQRVNHIIDAYKRVVALLPLSHRSDINGVIAITCSDVEVTTINPYGHCELTGIGYAVLECISTNQVLPVYMASKLVELSKQTEEQQRKWFVTQFKYKLNELNMEANKWYEYACYMMSLASKADQNDTRVKVANAEAAFQTAHDNVDKANRIVKKTEDELDVVLRDRNAKDETKDKALEERRVAGQTVNAANSKLVKDRKKLDVARQLMNPTKMLNDWNTKMLDMDAVITIVSESLNYFSVYYNEESDCYTQRHLRV